MMKLIKARYLLNFYLCKKNEYEKVTVYCIGMFSGL